MPRALLTLIIGNLSRLLWNLNHGILNNLPLLLPPSNEQEKIVSRVEELMAICEQLKAKINFVQTTKLHVADAMAQQALN